MNQIEQVKHDGAVKGLSDFMHSRLWHAQRACESASKDLYKDFVKEVTYAKALLDDAMAAYNAWIGMRSKSNGDSSK